MKRLIFYLFLGSFLFSCEKEEELKPTAIIPLSVGNEWFFERFEDGVVTDTLFHIIESSEEMYIDGQRINAYKVIAGSLGEADYNAGTLLANDETGGIVQLGICYLDDMLVMPSSYFNYPVSEGTIWEYNHLVFSGDKADIDFELMFDGVETMECIKVNQDIFINGKLYNCTVYKDSFTPYDDEIWARIFYLSPGVGIVKMQHWINDHLNNETVLYDHRLN